MGMPYVHRILELRSFVQARQMATAGGDQALPPWAEEIYAPVLEAKFDERMAAVKAQQEQAGG